MSRDRNRFICRITVPCSAYRGNAHKVYSTIFLYLTRWLNNSNPIRQLDGAWRAFIRMQKRFRDNGLVPESLDVCRLSINFGPILRHSFWCQTDLGSSASITVTVTCRLRTLFPPRWSVMKHAVQSTYVDTISAIPSP